MCREGVRAVMERRNRKLNKYRNIPTASYASKKEAKRAFELKLLERNGEITQLQEQPVFELLEACRHERAVHYRADFSYRDQNGVFVVEDVKGLITPMYKLKRKMFLHRYGFAITEV